MQQSAVGGQPLFAVEKSDRQLSVPQIRSPAQSLSSSQSPSPKSHVSLVVQQAHWTIGTALHLSFPSTIEFYRSVSTYQCDIINKNWMTESIVHFGESKLPVSSRTSHIFCAIPDMLGSSTSGTSFTRQNFGFILKNGYLNIHINSTTSSIDCKKS